MNPSFRRLLALVAVFAIAFVAVRALRTWQSEGNWRSMFPGLVKTSGHTREIGTLREGALLDLREVELLSRLNEEYARLTEAVVPSVVSIDTAGIRSERLLDPWGQSRVRSYPTQGQGSGVIVTYEGHVLTNHHVIAGQQKIQVTLHGGKTYSARLIGEDTLLDIAVLKIDSNETFVPLTIGDSSEVKVGQIVLAVGNPFGLGETVTQGIISAKERSLSDNQRDLLQTDAAVNPGNSGGPLVNLRGEIIGINVAIFSRDRVNPGFQGVGFSIPSNDAKDALFQILERGRPIRGFLGVEMRDLDPRVRAVLGYLDGTGAAVSAVAPDSPAEEAGLRPLDVIRSVNGEEILASGQLLALVQRSRVGQVMELDVWRNGEILELKATIAESRASKMPTTGPGGQGRTPGAQQVLQALGIQVRDLTVIERRKGLLGVVVTGIAPSGAAGNLIQAGDLIVAINDSRFDTAAEFSQHLAASAAVQETSLLIIRGGNVLRLTIPALPREE
jgi:serine protease Do